MVSAVVFAVVLAADSALPDGGVEQTTDAGVEARPAQPTGTGYHEIIAYPDPPPTDTPKVAEAPSPAPPEEPGASLPAFEVGATVMGTGGTVEFLVGPTFRFSLRDEELLVAGSLDWPIGAGPGRVVVLGGAGYTREVFRRIRLYGLGLGGISAVNGPPVKLLPVLALRLGGNWLLSRRFLGGVGASLTVAYDIPYAWNPTEGRATGLTFWAAVTAAWEVGR